MFQCHTEKPISIESSWKTEHQSTEGFTQTEECKTTDVEVQVVNSSEASIQAEEEVSSATGPAHYNEDSLRSFLLRVTPKVLTELNRQSRSRAFDFYSPVDNEEQTGVKLLYTLRWGQLFADGAVTGIDWNHTGSVIAVSYGCMVHDNWCNHKGVVAFWNINRTDFNVNQPEHLIEVSSCVLCLAFHPTNPALLAVGSFSGEVSVYDLIRSEEVTPIVTGDCGGGGVTSVAWVHAEGEVTGGATRIGYALVATTGTGMVSLWNLHLAKQQLSMRSGFLLETRDLPRINRSYREETGGAGITVCSFNCEDPTLFVLGTDGGGLALCSTQAKAPIGTELNGVALTRCFLSSLASHSGKVLSVHFSRYHRNALVTCASDNQIRLYSLLQPNKPVSVIHSEVEVSMVRSSPSRPLALAAGRANGEVALYDWGAKSGTASLVLPPHEKAAPVTWLQFNGKKISLLAVGDNLGRVFLWQLPSEMVSSMPSEQKHLLQLLTVSGDDDK